VIILKYHLPISVRSILILSSHLSPGLQSRGVARLAQLVLPPRAEESKGGEMNILNTKKNIFLPTNFKLLNQRQRNSIKKMWFLKS
jgi:hypothetical protein